MDSRARRIAGGRVRGGRRAGTRGPGSRGRLSRPGHPATGAPGCRRRQGGSAGRCLRRRRRRVRRGGSPERGAHAGRFAGRFHADAVPRAPGQSDSRPGPVRPVEPAAPEAGVAAGGHAAGLTGAGRRAPGGHGSGPRGTACAHHPLHCLCAEHARERWHPPWPPGRGRARLGQPSTGPEVDGLSRCSAGVHRDRPSGPLAAAARRTEAAPSAVPPAAPGQAPGPGHEAGVRATSPPPGPSAPRGGLRMAGAGLLLRAVPRPAARRRPRLTGWRAGPAAEGVGRVSGPM